MLPGISTSMSLINEHQLSKHLLMVCVSAVSIALLVSGYLCLLYPALRWLPLHRFYQGLYLIEGIAAHIQIARAINWFSLAKGR